MAWKNNDIITFLFITAIITISLVIAWILIDQGPVSINKTFPFRN